MLNNVIITGRLTADVEIKEVGENKVVNFTVACNRSYKNKEGEYDTDFISCVAWNGVADNMSEYLKKGDLVGVEGSLITSTYEKDGVKHYKTEVRADKITFLTPKKVEVVEDGK